jgi:hypothetical protein
VSIDRDGRLSATVHLLPIFRSLAPSRHDGRASPSPSHGGGTRVLAVRLTVEFQRSEGIRWISVLGKDGRPGIDKLFQNIHNFLIFVADPVRMTLGRLTP